MEQDGDSWCYYKDYSYAKNESLYADSRYYDTAHN